MFADKQENYNKSSPVNPRDVTTKNVQFGCLNSALKISQQELKSSAKQR